MLDTAQTYRTAIDELTGDRAMDMHKIELSDAEYEMGKQLRDVLHVRHKFGCLPTRLPVSLFVLGAPFTHLSD